VACLVGGFWFNAGPAAAAQNLNVPVVGQRDQAWAQVLLGTDRLDTIGSDGCALASVTMVQRYFGVATDPVKLNQWLVANDGYIQEDLILWRQAMVATAGKVRWKWRHIPDLSPLLRTQEQDDPGTLSPREARAELDAGNMVVVEVKNRGRQHFVVLTGYAGGTFYINDPWYGDRSTLNARYGPWDQAVFGSHVFYRES
jgi:hypothetical protein